MYIRIRYNNEIKSIPEISKRAPVKDLKKQIAKMFNLEPKSQRLFALGKQLEDGYDLHDFNLDVNCLVDVMKRVAPPPEPVEKVKSVKVDKEDKMEEIEMEDLEDKENSQANNQQLAKVTPKPAKAPLGEKSTSTNSTSASTPASTPASTSTSSRTTRATTSAGDDENTVIKLSDIFDGNVAELCLPTVECKKCNDNPNKLCKECACNVCGGKDRPGENLMCDECEYCYHMDCLDPPLDAIPDGDWYCPVCKNDENEVVMAGQALKIGSKKAKLPSYQNKCKRDWGSGFATAGRQKSCTKVPPNYFGQIPGTDVGMSWLFRIQVSQELFL